MRFHSFLITASFLIAGPTVSAQSRPAGEPAKPPRYVPFPITKDPEALVQAQLGAIKKLEPYKEFVEKMLRDPEKFKVDPALVKQLNLDNPAVRDKLKQWVDREAQGKPPVSPAQLKRLQEDVQKLFIEQPAESPPPVGSMPAPAPEPLVAPPTHDSETQARDWLKEMMERAQESRFGEWLRESPVWQDVERDLARGAGSFRPPDRAGWERLTRRWLQFDKMPVPDMDALSERLGRIRPPGLPRWTPSMPSLARPSLPSATAPSLPTASNVGTLALWLVVIGFVAFIAWLFAKWIALPAGRARGAQAALGPWPVDPQQVVTRGDLVRAFDYLAVLLLGDSVRTAHHRAIERAMAQRAGHAEAAVELAALYEAARYTEGADLLPVVTRDRARLVLAQLAEVAAA